MYFGKTAASMTLEMQLKMFKDVGNVHSDLSRD